MILENIHLRNEACPKCKERGRDNHNDNLGVFSDGHKFCWSCGYYEPANVKQLINALKQGSDGTSSIEATPLPSLDFPEDVEPGLRFDAHFWLSSYGITNEDIYTHKIMWSEKRELLVFPIFDQNNNLLGWQGRSFSKDKKGKYYSKGPLNNILHLINSKNISAHGIVLVEDLISAIKVGHYACTMPLFGSHVSLEKLTRLHHLTNRLIFWLDHDKLDQSHRFARSAELL